MRPPVFALVVVVIATSAGGPGAATAAPGFNDDACLKCHGDPGIDTISPEERAAMVRDGAAVLAEESSKRSGGSTDHSLHVRVEGFSGTPHVALSCVQCHTGIESLPHARELAAVDCGPCHVSERDEYESGPHSAQAGTGVPRCVDCHREPHAIPWKPRKRTFADAKGGVELCVRCHDQANDPSGHLAAAQTYRASVHGEGLFKVGLPFSATCVDCHGAHGVLPASREESPIHHNHVEGTCARCHQGIDVVFAESVHGKALGNGNGDAAVCTTCHSSHGVRGVGDAFIRSLYEECSSCHDKLGKSYLASYHGKATLLHHHSTAVCTSCHGAHDIKPIDDPLSRVHAANVEATCGKCHFESVNDNFVLFQPHADHRDRENYPEVYYTWLVMTTLLVSVLLVFVPHSILWAIRETIARLRRPNYRPAKSAAAGTRQIQRFHPVHRWTHLLIIVSFTGLVATGFPLKYSTSGWAKALSSFFGGAESMAVLHRIFAVMTFVYTLIHVAYLIHFFVRKCPRPRWKYLFGPESMILSIRDLRQFFAMIRWFFFLGPKPRFDRWMYLEKFDYWGEIWGVIVIGGSGLILWFPGFFTQWLPGWILNCAVVVHSIEALLAASVIFIVHFLNTHLRPDKFPVDTVMFTGSMSESEMREERPAEYDRLVESGELDRRVVPRVSSRRRRFGFVAGIFAFLCGLTLILLALATELGEIS